VKGLGGSLSIVLFSLYGCVCGVVGTGVFFGVRLWGCVLAAAVWSGGEGVVFSGRVFLAVGFCISVME